MGVLRLVLALALLCASAAVVYVNFVRGDLDEVPGSRVQVPGSRTLSLPTGSYELWVQGGGSACHTYGTMRQAGLRLVSTGETRGRVRMRGGDSCRTMTAEDGRRRSSVRFEGTLSGRYELSVRRRFERRAEIFLVARRSPADLVMSVIWGAVALVLFAGVFVALFGRQGPSDDPGHVHHGVFHN